MGTALVLGIALGEIVGVAVVGRGVGVRVVSLGEFDGINDGTSGENDGLLLMLGVGDGSGVGTEVEQYPQQLQTTSGANPPQSASM